MPIGVMLYRLVDANIERMDAGNVKSAIYNLMKGEATYVAVQRCFMALPWWTRGAKAYDHYVKCINAVNGIARKSNSSRASRSSQAPMNQRKSTVSQRRLSKASPQTTKLRTVADGDEKC